MEQHIQLAWKRIEVWLERNVPELTNTLCAGASITQIQAAEQSLGIKFPDDVRISYALHNGEVKVTSSSQDYLGLFDSDGFLGLDEMVSQWQSWTESLRFVDQSDTNRNQCGEVKDLWWSPLWVPITHSLSGNDKCLDLDPALNGNYGQIISVWTDPSPRVVKFTSFAEMLEDYAIRLETGQIVFSEEYRCLVDIEELSDDEWKSVLKKRAKKGDCSTSSESTSQTTLDL
jgi:cell wall assembly regulator SMI1